MQIFVGNLSFAATDLDVKKAFEVFGSVASVVIVTEKKSKKSRGFGFVDMPDEQQAQAAIEALNSKEWMGRPLNVNPARPKTEEEREAEKEKRIKAKVEAKARAQAIPRKEKTQKEDAWFNPAFNKTGGYKGGRRTRSYMRKVIAKPKEFLKPGAQPKPWRKPEEHSKPWHKTGEHSKPWQKKPGELKPKELPKPGWKTRGKPKPWQKPEGQPKPWRKTEGESKPWHKASAHAKPWKKTEVEAKPWRKSNERPQQSRAKGHKKADWHKK
jgi:RNA recognition motif-containing protein